MNSRAATDQGKKEESPAQAMPAGVMTIGLCDDGALQRAYLKVIIREYESSFRVRFNLYEFGSGEELLEKFNHNPNLWDLFFLDKVSAEKISSGHRS